MTKILKKYLIVIVGPTASGKTNLAIKVAEKLKLQLKKLYFQKKHKIVIKKL